MSIIDKNRDSLFALCNRYNVDKLYVFGSVLTENFDKSSDIDFIVNFKNVSLYDYADNYYNLKSALEILFNKKIDLLEDPAIKNPYLRQSIDATKQLVYGS